MNATEEHTNTLAVGEHFNATNKWAILCIAASAGFITSLDGSIVNIGLPLISATFHVGVSGPIEWIIIGYLVVVVSILLTCGRLADLIGRKPIFIWGLIVFIIGSALCGLASSLLLLILARLFQGIGASLIFSVNVAMITSTFTARDRGLALGLNAVVVSLGVSAGPTIGGFIIQYLSWRWLFYVNVPIVLILLVLTLLVYHEAPHHQGLRGHFDPIGAVLLGAGFSLLTLGLSFGQEWGWLSIGLLSSLTLGIAMLVIAIPMEQRIKHPILDVHLLKNRVFVFANLSFMLCMMALFTPGFIMPFYFEQLRGFSTVQTGLLLTPLPLTFALAAPLSGSLADRFGSRWISPIGLSIACFGLFLLSLVNAHSSMLDIIWRLALTGIGQGIFQSPNTRTIMGEAPASEQGEASGLFATGRVMGQSLGVALIGTIFVAFGGSYAGTMLASHAQSLSPAKLTALQNLFDQGYHAAVLTCALLASIGIFTVLARGKGAASGIKRQRISA
jgi:drug resistance transporter, EmrB/QacA subfamily